MKITIGKDKQYPIGVELPVLRSTDIVAGSFFNWLRQEQPQVETTVDVAARTTFQDYYDILTLFKQLDDLKVGDFIVGRKGRESRIEWKYTIQSICSLAFEEIDENELLPITPEYRQESIDYHPKDMLEHEFLLRPETKLKITLPYDFNEGDCQRLTRWLNTLPFD